MQGTAGTTEDAFRYGWNYALLLAQGPSPEALVDSPVLSAMRTGRVVRVEEITRCLPEVQDALVSILSDRRVSVPDLTATEDAVVPAAPGFTVIATANLRDRGVSEMSAALKRRFNFETSPRSPTRTPRPRWSAARPSPPSSGRAPPSASTTPCSTRSSPSSATCARAAPPRAGTSSGPVR